MAQNQSRNQIEKRFSHEFEVRKLPITAIFSLTKLLEDQSAWRKVMSLVRKDSPEAGRCPLKYTADHIRMIEVAAHEQHRAATVIFLEEWGCSGRRRPTLGCLLDLLVEAQLYGAADFIAVELLDEQPPPRPHCGPAAKVLWADGDKCITPLSIEPSAPQILSRDISTGSNYTSVDALGFNEDSNSHSETKIQRSLYNYVSDSHRLGQEMETLCVSHNNRQNHTQLFPYSELHAMTEGFNALPITDPNGRLLGSGAFGSVFLATLKDKLVAVKRLYKDAEDIDVPKQFFNEVEALSRIHHPHLLQLLGYSCDGPAYCLVYEFMSHGNLQERLACKGKWTEPLSWMDRMKISLGTARGLLHLHSFKPRPLLHRDVKSSNILLDAQSQPKIGDFGLVRLGKTEKETQVVTTVIGTSAYMAPEVFRGDVSVKMDVFSFGVVLLELLTGLPPYDEEREGCDLVTHVTETCDDSIVLLLDRTAGSWQSNEGKNISHDLYTLARMCLDEKKNRPEMFTVVEFLDPSQNTCETLAEQS